MDLKTVYNLFTDCWKLYKSFCDSKLDDAALADFALCVEELQRKYDKSPFAHDLLLAVINEVDRIEKAKHEKRG